MSSGLAHLMGHEITAFPTSTFGKLIGICNQGNLIWDNLTTEESLDMVADLRGLEPFRRKEHKDLLLKTLELTEFRNTLCGNLSGGNKRKLCCAMSLIICPRILFMDEPTTGVDPVSRRAFIRMIHRIKSGSIMLTTHRMDEAEQLCDKIAIMINGKFVVFGSPNMLRSEYGTGYQISILQDANAFRD